ncbi:MAG: hypothetical protein Kow0069_15100 [Promethearchaeota archaeon]
MGLYHFNLQYAAGLPASYFKQHEASFRPFLSFFERFPGWRVDLELSGHHVAFLERHFPEDLERLRALNARGQVEVVCVHYSDQIYLAYPKFDLVKSIELADEILERNGLKRSPVWFGQENFFGEGVAEVMVQCGYSVALVNRHHYQHFHPAPPPAAYYRLGDVDVLFGGRQRVVGPDGEDLVVADWNFWGDGELAFARANVYFPGYGPSRRKFVERANAFFRRQRAGVRHVTVTEYLREVKAAGHEPVELERFPDGSWNHYYYGGAYLWMGTYRMPFERDGRVRSETVRTRARVLLAERLLERATERGFLSGVSLSRVTAKVKRAWKHQLLAEVSDSTGQTPLPVEVKYSFAEAAQAARFADLASAELAAALGVGGHWVDLETGATSPRPSRPLTKALEAFDDLPSASPERLFRRTGCRVFLRDVARRSLAVRIKEVGDRDHFVLDLRFKRGKWVPLASRVLSLLRSSKRPRFSRFVAERLNARSGFWLPLRTDLLCYSPACAEGRLSVHRVDQLACDETWVPCPNGVLLVAGCGEPGDPDNVFLVKHAAIGGGHLAYVVDFARRRVGVLTLNPPKIWFHWRFSIFRGTPEEALRLGNALNVVPEVRAPSGRGENFF